MPRFVETHPHRLAQSAPAVHFRSGAKVEYGGCRGRGVCQSWPKHLGLLDSRTCQATDAAPWGPDTRSASRSSFPLGQCLLGTASPGSGKLASMRKELAKHRVAMAVQPGAPIFELSVPCEVFGVCRPDIHDPWYDFQVCPTTPAARVANGFVADQAGTMRDLAQADTLVIIGPRTSTPSPRSNSWTPFMKPT